jgi:hypothetical protein
VLWVQQSLCTQKKKKTRRRGRGRGRRRNKIACVFGLPVEQNCEYSFPCKFDCGMGKIEDISTFEQIEF